MLVIVIVVIVVLSVFISVVRLVIIVGELKSVRCCKIELLSQVEV